jgi:hypothetical protein
MLQISANRPRVAGRQVTTLLREDDAWIAQVDLHLEVTEGLVDELRLQLPTGFGSQITIEPPLAHRLSAGGEATGRELLVSPDSAIREAFHVSLRLPCPAPQGQNMQVPDIRLRDVPELQRIVVVPRAIDQQNIEWQVDRLLVLPDERRQQFGLADSETIAYRVVSDPFHAELRALRRVAGVPLVRLADVRFAWTGGRCSGWTTFDLEPAGLNYCTVAVPPNYRLVHVRAGEVAAQVQPISTQRWRIALRPQGMPQRIEVFYQGELTPENSQRRLQAASPVLEDIAVQRTLWTVYAPLALGRGVPQTGGEISPLRQDLVRLRSLCEVMRLPRHVRVETTARETNDWIAAWESRWQAVRSDVDRAQLQSLETPDEKTSLTELQAIDDDHEQILDDLDVAPPLPMLSSDQPAALPEFWRFTVARGDLATRTMVQGSHSVLTVNFPQAASASPARWIFGGFLAVAGLALLIARRWLPQSDGLLRSGRAIGVLVGIAWALWLWPWWVGWVIVLLFLLPQRRLAWRRTSSESGSAIVVRSTSGASR